ncbi:MAG: methyltransferase domain-containing protein [Rhodococcus sp. (in: high G+C Gram-positive bacteria)]
MIPTRWALERSTQDSHSYVARFRELESAGDDMHGEARFVDAVLPRAARVLDAGCGTGRLGAELSRRGHSVLAVDLDPVLVAEARTHPDLEVVLDDLATMELAPQSLDAVVAAGNVMVFLAPGTEAAVLAKWHDALIPAGVVIAGFATDRDYTVENAERDLAAAGFTAVQRFSTWSVGVWADDADWAVLVARRD